MAWPAGRGEAVQAAVRACGVMGHGEMVHGEMVLRAVGHGEMVLGSSLSLRCQTGSHTRATRVAAQPALSVVASTHTPAYLHTAGMST